MDPRYKSPTAEVIDRDDEDEFRDLTTLTTVVVWMLRAGVVFALIALWSAWMQVDLLSHVYSPDEASANDRREAAVAGVVAVLMIATFVVFGRWIVLAHRNLPALGAQYLEVRPGWALGVFFIPFINIWKPFQAMRSLWRSSHSVHRPETQDSTWVLPTWWTLWLVFNFSANIPQSIERASHSVDGLRSATLVAMVMDVLYILLCFVASILVSRIWHAQEKQRENPEEFEPPKGFADLPSTA